MKGVVNTLSAICGLLSLVLYSAVLTAQNPEKVSFVCVQFDARGCPTEVSNEDLLLDGSSAGSEDIMVSWLAVSSMPEPGQCAVTSSDGKEWPNKVERDFMIIFSPFHPGGVFDRGKTRGRVDSGKLREAKIGIPADIDVHYKYTIYAPSDCPDEPLDPRIRVQ